MDLGESYVRRIKEIKATLDRYNEITRGLRQKRKDAEKNLWEWMKKRGLESYQGYNLQKIAPKPKMIIPKKEEKRAAAVGLFSQLGVNDPDGLWEELEKSRKAKVYRPEDKK